MKNCIYCKAQLPNESVIDVCHRCGIQVWGERMFSTILENMKSAHESGDLYQGSVTSTTETIKQKNNSQETSSSKIQDTKKAPLANLAQEAIANIDTHSIQYPEEQKSAPTSVQTETFDLNNELR